MNGGAGVMVSSPRSSPKIKQIKMKQPPIIFVAKYTNKMFEGCKKEGGAYNLPLQSICNPLPPSTDISGYEKIGKTELYTIYEFKS